MLRHAYVSTIKYQDRGTSLDFGRCRQEEIPWNLVVKEYKHREREDRVLVFYSYKSHQFTIPLKTSGIHSDFILCVSIYASTVELRQAKGIILYAI